MAEEKYLEADEAMQLEKDGLQSQSPEEGTVQSLGVEEEKQLVWKIDLNLMPIMFVSYILQYIDKTSLANGAILGLRKDLHLVGQQYSWSSGMFYIGYLAASYPMSLGFVKFPLGKYLSVMVVLWGVCLTLHSVAGGYAGLMVLRTLLGVFESAISPGFSLITSTWYTPREHSLRHSIWFSGNAIGGILGSLIAYGIVFYTGSIAKWKLSDLKKFSHTTQTKKLDRDQFIEALKDVKTWWVMCFMFVSSVPNGGISSFQTIIINGFGFSVPRTILMNMPGFGFQFFAVVTAALATTFIRRSRLITLSMVFVPTLTGAVMLKVLPAHEKWSRLAGLWLSTMLAPLLPLLLSFCASNTAGFTKKSITLAMMFVGYCVGNFVGPQFFISTEAPGYKTAWDAILSCFAICLAMPIGMRIYLMLVNKRRDESQGQHIDPEAVRRVHLDEDMDLASLDETDWKNPSFRYIL
ncbi:hypothetical protein NQ176_g2309 [Zarea fungicola]|uniref:Uncharacterized protein n=1 Tax=Zarea fungicola TaxID=93591 RepID=A0ACC1NRG6_9HYPO|nr:hypothetical protein NQ176_g2309 [Lecanicillium fungicola]